MNIFKKSRVRKASIEIALLALFTAIAVLLNVFDIPLTGGTQKLTLSYLAPFFAGALLGPLSGFAVGAIGDVIGLLINPQGAWLPTITLAAGLIGVISGLIFKLPRLPVVLKIILSFLLSLLICSAGINTTTIWLAYGIKKAYFVYLFSRLPFQALCAAVNAVIAALLYPLLRSMTDRLLRRTKTEKRPAPAPAEAPGAPVPDSRPDEKQ